MRGLRRTTLAVVGAALAGITVAPAASGSHLPGFGHDNTVAPPSGTGTICTIDDACLIAQNNDTGNTAVGVLGRHIARGGSAPGVLGETNSVSQFATGVLGRVNPDPNIAGGSTAGVRGVNNTIAGFGVAGSHAGSGFGVYGTSPTGTGVFGEHSGATGFAPAAGVRGDSSADAVNAAGVYGTLEAAGAAAGSAGVYGVHESTGALGIGVRGQHNGAGNGVYGSVQLANVGAAGVLGQVLATGGGGVAVHGHHNGSGYGVYGNTSGAGAGVVGNQSQAAGFAGFFFGRVHATGMLTKGGGAFKIDHPLDPANKYLQHSFVESPDMKNVYDGVVRTDRRGFATVKLPRYFQALNRDFRYQLTSLSGLQDVAVARKIESNRFVIQSEKPFSEISWQVAGIRKDRWANANRIQVEQAKDASERGRYLNPELYGMPAPRSVLVRPSLPKVPG